MSSGRRRGVCPTVGLWQSVSMSRGIRGKDRRRWWSLTCVRSTEPPRDTKKLTRPTQHASEIQFSWTRGSRHSTRGPRRGRSSGGAPVSPIRRVPVRGAHHGKSTKDPVHAIFTREKRWKLQTSYGKKTLYTLTPRFCSRTSGTQGRCKHTAFPVVPQVLPGLRAGATPCLSRVASGLRAGARTVPF